MSKISELDLISSADVSYENICTLRPPTLDKIRLIGIEKYYFYLNVILIDLDTYLDELKIRDSYDKLDEVSKSQCSIFDFLIGVDDTRNNLQESLSFFIAEKLQYDSVSKTFLLIDEKSNKIVGVIDRDSFEEIKDGICQLSYINRDNAKSKKTKNKLAEKILLKIKKGREELAKANKADANKSIPNIISAIVTYHSSYNYENIWSLTVYQLYDLFSRLNTKKQLDMAVMAAFSKDFDYEIWYKNPNL